MLFDQSYHMTDMYIEGPGALELLSAVGINSFEHFAPGKAKQFVVCNSDGYVIGDAILFHLEDELLQPRRPPLGAQLGAVPLRDRRLRRDDASATNDAAVNPNNRKVYRYQVQGPNALEVLEKVNGGPLPETRFFNMDWITIAGRQVRALHHGMSGVPGREMFGPWADGDDVKAAIRRGG